MVVGHVDVEELRQRTGLRHAVKVRDELLGAALVGDVEVVAGIVGVEPGLAVVVRLSEDGQHGQIHEVRLTQTLRLRGHVAGVDQRIGDVKQVR